MAAPLTAAEARALLHKRLTVRRAARKAAQAAKADARARRVVDMVDQGLTHEDIAQQLGIKLSSVRGLIRAARKRLARTV